MARTQLDGVLRHVRALRDAETLADVSDAQLLQRFTAAREEGAFTVLLRRHGPMVLSVARGTLGNAADAEDVFQAAFLLLARKAGSIRKQASVASWLHGVAYRLAVRVKTQGRQRQARERQAADMHHKQKGGRPGEPDVRAVLDAALGELPECYRAALVLCYLEGQTHEEAARQLGCPLATLRTRVARGRKLLRDRLAGHGLTLSTAGLLALLVAGTATAAAPASLLREVARAAVPLAAGQPAATVCSARVAELVEGGLGTMLFSKTKVATALLLAASLLAGAGAFLHHRLAAAEKPKEQTPPAPAPAAGDVAKGSVKFAGRVLDPDGKPVPGAKLYLLYYTPRELPVPVRAVSDKEGGFRFTADRKDFDQSASARPWDEAFVVAMADGYGLGVPDFQPGKPWSRTDQTLRLVKDDVAITGRILDLQGKPVAGVRVRVHGFYWSPKGDLTAWLRDLKERKEGYPALRAHLIELGGLWMGRDLGKVFPAAVTDADGRFRLRGVGRERVVALRLNGGGIVSTELFAMTRPGGVIRTALWRRDSGDGEMIFCGPGFEQVIAPSRPIVGVVRDRDTGKPLPGAVVQSSVFAQNRRVGMTHVRAVADGEGRYRLDGMPKGKGNAIRAAGPDGKPYLMARIDVPDDPGLGPVTVDIRLKRGVWIHGKVTDKVTGKPVPSTIRCDVFDENPFLKEAPGLTFDPDMRTSPVDGTFRFAGLPGRGVVVARAWQPGYRTDVGAGRIKGQSRLALMRPFNTAVEINPAADAESVRCDIVLDPGRVVAGTVVGPDGKPLAGVLAAGLDAAGAWESQPLRAAAFTVVGLKPGEARLLQFSHPGKRLAGSLVVRGDTRGPVTVRLGPAGTLAGRFVQPDGKPWADLGLFPLVREPVADPTTPARPPDPTIGSFPRGVRTGKDGRFRIEGLAPGLKYRVALWKGRYVLTPEGPVGTTGVSVEAGKTKDVGDVTIKPIE